MNPFLLKKAKGKYAFLGQSLIEYIVMVGLLASALYFGAPLISDALRDNAAGSAREIADMDAQRYAAHTINPGHTPSTELPGGTGYLPGGIESLGDAKSSSDRDRATSAGSSRKATSRSSRARSSARVSSRASTSRSVSGGGTLTSSDSSRSSISSSTVDSSIGASSRAVSSKAVSSRAVSSRATSTRSTSVSSSSNSSIGAVSSSSIASSDAACTWRPGHAKSGLTMTARMLKSGSSAGGGAGLGGCGGSGSSAVASSSSSSSVAASSAESVFNHKPTSGVVVKNNAKNGTYLIGNHSSDLQYILRELNYPQVQGNGLNFSLPIGQKFNLLNVSNETYNYWAANGGFFTKVNGPWIDSAVVGGHDIIVLSKVEKLYSSTGVLSGFGKEIHRLEWKHGYRYDPETNMMVPPSSARLLPILTLHSDYPLD